MPQALTCSRCGAALEVKGRPATVRCAYCGTVVSIPEAGWPADAQGKDRPAVDRRVVRYLVLFLVLVLGLPTCVGLAGSLLGVLAGVVAPLLAILLSFFVRG